MKLVVVGGGGSRTPLLYQGLVARRRSLPPVELVLYDPAPERLARVGKVLAGLDEQAGQGVPTRATTDLQTALDDATFVFGAVRVGGFEARRLDEDIPMSRGVVGQETVGPGGFALALRNIPVLVQLAEAMRRRCPEAWLVNLTNPAGMVTQALAPLLGMRVVGVCDSPLALGRHVAAALGVDLGELHLQYAGLNHLGWLTAAWQGGRDLLPELLASPALERVEEARLAGLATVRAKRVIPNEYLYFYSRPAAALANVRQAGASRGDFLAAEQQALAADLDAARSPAAALEVYRRSLGTRNDTYMTVEAQLSRPASADVFAAAGGYHEVALSVVEAVACDRPSVLVVNTTNRGALPFLRDDDVVEVPAVVSAAGVFPLAAALPEPERDLVERVKAYERAALAALESGSAAAARAALASHPLVPSGEVARSIVQDYLSAMPELAGRLRGA